MDRQIERLTRELRDKGVPPERDLWPEIEARLEDPHHRTCPEGDRWWRVAAVAAALIVLVASGYLTGGTDPAVETAANPLIEGPGDPIALLQDMNQTIGELEAAQDLNPENLNLSRLTALAHRGRADLLRATTRRTI